MFLRDFLIIALNSLQQKKQMPSTQQHHCIIILWEFFVKKECEAQFFKAYAAEGTWGKFFKKGKGFIRTELLKDAENPLRYVTIDYWNTVEEYERFRKEHLSEYQRIDEHNEKLTERENFIGIFTYCK